MPEFGRVSPFGKLPNFSASDVFTLNPSTPSLHRSESSHSRTNSDAHVQGMVARFNQLDIKDLKELHRRDEVAIKRAEMAREMAEMELARCRREKDELEERMRSVREDGRTARKELEDSKDRERRTGKRLEVSMVGLAHS